MVTAATTSGIGDVPSRPQQSPPQRQLLLDAAVAAAVCAASVLLLIVGSEVERDGGQVDAASLALTALASLPLVARRRSPIAVFVVTALASTALFAVAQPAGPPLGPTVALYFLAAADERPLSAPLAFGLVAALLIGHAAAAGLSDDRFPGTELAFGVLVWGGAWLAGERTRLRNQRLVELEERALRAEREAERERQLAAAEERNRLARDLHDSAGHAINTILVHAGLGRLKSGADPGRGAEEFATIEQVARETVGEIDQLVGALRDQQSPTQRETAARHEAVSGSAEGTVEPPAGLASLEPMIERHRAAGMEVKVGLRGEHRPLPTILDTSAYRILQEALTNASRYGDGEAEVLVVFSEHALELTVTNGVGAADRTSRPTGGGHGVVGMHERAVRLGGRLEIGVDDGQFRVQAWLPLDQGKR